MMNVNTTGIADVRIIDLKTGKVIAELGSLKASTIEIDYKHEEKKDE